MINNSRLNVNFFDILANPYQIQHYFKIVNSKSPKFYSKSQIFGVFVFEIQIFKKLN